MSRSRLLRPAAALLAATTVALLAACKAEQQTPAAGESAAAQPSAAAPAASGEQTPDAGGKVVTIQMGTDAQGNNVFEPAEVQANPGDVLRYTLKDGVHNVHFLADSNPGRTGLPAASEMLQLAGQTHDVKVTWAPGSYYYQCDPHALLGMKGHVTVAAK